MVPFPGIGAMIRMPKAANDKAMSSSKFLILEIRTPASGTISYSVTEGPTTTSIFEILILKSNRVLTILSLLRLSSFSLYVISVAP